MKTDNSTITDQSVRPFGRWPRLTIPKNIVIIIVVCTDRTELYVGLSQV